MDTHNSDGVNSLIGIINDVLASQGIRAIEGKKDFVESDFSHENCVVYTIANTHTTELRFAFDNTGLKTASIGAVNLTISPMTFCP